MARRSAKGRRWVMVLVPVVALVASLVTLAVDREMGILALVQLMERVRETDARVAALAMEKEELQRQVWALRSDAFAIEVVARAKLGMARADEVVILLESDTPGAD